MRRRNRVQRPIRISITSRWARGGRGGCGLGRTNALSMFHPHASRGKELVNPTMTCAFVSRGIKVHPTLQKVSEIQGSRPPWT